MSVHEQLHAGEKDGQVYLSNLRTMVPLHTFSNPAVTLAKAEEIAKLLDDVTWKDAAHLVYKLVDKGLGLPGGSFTDALIEAMVRADDEKLSLLGHGFPGPVAAYRLYHRCHGGTEVLKRRALEEI